jgi:hypothetical protein
VREPEVNDNTVEETDLERRSTTTLSRSPRSSWGTAPSGHRGMSPSSMLWARPTLR